jgi:histone H3/H4
MDRITGEAVRRAIELGLSAQFSAVDESAVDTLTCVLEQIVIRAGKRARIIAESANRSEVLPQDIEASIFEWDRYTSSVDVLPDLKLSCTSTSTGNMHLPQFQSALVNSANLRKTPVSVFPNWLVKEAEALSKIQTAATTTPASLAAPVPPPAGLAEEEARNILAAKKPHFTHNK